MADDHYAFGAVPVIVPEIAAFQNRDAQSFEKARRYGPEFCAWIILAVLAFQAFQREGEADVLGPSIAPGNGKTRRDVRDSRHGADAALHVTIKLAHLLWRSTIGHHRQIHRQDVCRFEWWLGSFQYQQSSHQRACAGQQKK